MENEMDPDFALVLEDVGICGTKRGGAVQILSKIEILNREQDW